MTAPAPALTAVLDELDELRAKATPGEWSNPYPFTKLIDAPDSTDNLAIVQCDNAADAALIVAAVNRLPELTAALRAVQALHTNTVAYVGVGDAEIDVCSTCFDQDENPEPWPCPTVTAITTALEAS